MSKPAVERLQDALDRLLVGKPERVKATGRITLNKINREAGFGQSYIHKFKSFINDVANPAIKKYNKNLGKSDLVSQSTTPSSEDMSVVDKQDKLKKDLEREINLKEKYRKERDALKVKLREQEAKNNILMYRVYELQEEFRASVHDMHENK
ncbi:hypothetical protein ACS86_00700 [Vibrio alginolyticus]|nr:hypothetical protein ACS86_00700 [Vibrio alginolyticus]HAS8621966.1 hypothetical protein [Vibrio vulnificus]